MKLKTTQKKLDNYKIANLAAGRQEVSLRLYSRNIIRISEHNIIIYVYHYTYCGGVTVNCYNGARQTRTGCTRADNKIIIMHNTSFNNHRPYDIMLMFVHTILILYDKDFDVYTLCIYFLFC